jgi:hypothetical protein
MNKLFVAGGPSPNPSGRPKMKHSALTLVGKTERLLNGYLGSKLFKKDFNNATGKERLDWSVKMGAIVIPKAQANSMGDAEIELFYQKLEQTLKDAQRKAI